MKRVFLSALAACTISGAAQSAVLPFGPQTNVAYDTVINDWGWTEANVTPANISSQDFGLIFDLPHAFIMVGSLHDGVFNVLAAAAHDDILVQTSGNDTHAANGSQWYWNPTKAFGFAGLGKAIDLSDTEPHLDVADPSDPDRLSILTGHIPGVGYLIHGESRSGTNLDLRSSEWFNVVLTADGIDAVPEPVTWMLMLFGFAAVGVNLRRRRAQLA